MASGITSKVYSSGGAYWIWLEWSSTTNVANNTSTVTIISYVGSNSYGYYSSSYNTGSVTLNGIASAYSSNSALSASTTKQELHRSTQTVTHNADGTKSITISANHKHSSTFNLTASQAIILDTIARASVPTLSVGSQNIGSAITINTNRASSGFTHYIYATFGSLSIGIASDVTTSAVWTLPASLATQIPNSLSGNGYIHVDTYSGSTYIGSKTIVFTAVVPGIAAYEPSINGLVSSISGTGRDKTLMKYVQSISKAVIAFNAVANGSATVSSNTINIKRQSDNGNSMTISGTSGTSGMLTLAGVYIITATTTDSRARVATATLTITVEAYVVPKITSFTAIRQAVIKTSVDTVKNGTYTYMGGNNPLTVLVARAPKGGAFTTLETTAGTTLGAFTGTYVATGTTDTASWEFKLTIVDSFGNSAVATLVVSTASVALSIKGDIGIGVGKVWERGTLDIQGLVYINNVELFALIYPIGAIYLSVTATSPATLFGGTWVAMANQFLIGAGTYPAGAVGGAATHTLTIAELATHQHNVGNSNTNGYAAVNTPLFPVSGGAIGYTTNIKSQYEGNGGAHNNMPPYLSVYMWKRTA